ncbi:uncharacterized protein LOC117170116 isoform X2 [Belonocnema kinseyi]|uniref:uncharacterized protein LOC117170116 isoform X2 n=1 Tax=Belonocnema kinseyi TaxID=2817044 RepID=UPI00143D7C1C|nr:uncharacterized protein LOC117170116 isoform X2 [Belonocnema kinseyi]
MLSKIHFKMIINIVFLSLFFMQSFCKAEICSPSDPSCPPRVIANTIAEIKTRPSILADDALDHPILHKKDIVEDAPLMDDGSDDEKVNCQWSDTPSRRVNHGPGPVDRADSRKYSKVRPWHWLDQFESPFFYPPAGLQADDDHRMLHEKDLREGISKYDTYSPFNEAKWSEWSQPTRYTLEDTLNNILSTYGLQGRRFNLRLSQEQTYRLYRLISNLVKENNWNGYRPDTITPKNDHNGIIAKK